MQGKNTQRSVWFETGEPTRPDELQFSLLVAFMRSTREIHVLSEFHGTPLPESSASRDPHVLLEGSDISAVRLKMATNRGLGSEQGVTSLLQMSFPFCGHLCPTSNHLCPTSNHLCPTSNPLETLCLKGRVTHEIQLLALQCL